MYSHAHWLNLLRIADNSRHLAKRHIDEKILCSRSGQSCSSVTLSGRRDCRYAIHCGSNVDNCSCRPTVMPKCALLVQWVGATVRQRAEPLRRYSEHRQVSRGFHGTAYCTRHLHCLPPCTGEHHTEWARKTGQFLKVCNSCMWWQRKANYQSKY